MGESDFSLSGSPCCVLQRLKNVFALKVGIVGENLLDGMASADLADNHAYSDAHPAYARFAAYDGWVLCNAIKFWHIPSLAKLPKLENIMLGTVREQKRPAGC